MERFSFKSGRAVQVVTRLANSVTIRISAQNNFMLLLKHFITKVLEYKAEELNLYVLLRMCSLVMSLCSLDLHVTSLNNITIH